MTALATATDCRWPPDRPATVWRTDRIVVTDSHPRAMALRSAFLEVDSTATLLAEHLISNR